MIQNATGTTFQNPATNPPSNAPENVVRGIVVFFRRATAGSYPKAQSSDETVADNQLRPIEFGP